MNAPKLMKKPTAICPKMKIMGAIMSPKMGIIDPVIWVNILTVIAIPPVERHNARSRLYDKIVPMKPRISMKPNIPLKNISIAMVAMRNGAKP